ncbi:hypothetical protein [Streptomyces sp. YKOK-I1]
MTEYRVQFTVEARAAYDTLPGDRRGRLDRTVRILARDPFREHATARLGPRERLRRTYAASGIMLTYLIAGASVVIVALEADDEFAYLVDEEDAV